MIAYTDTDGAFVVATPDGSEVDLLNGQVVPALTVDKVAEIVERFSPLAMSSRWPVWKQEQERFLVAFGPKRYAKCTKDSDGRLVVEDATEAGLGGVYVDDPAIPGRLPNDTKRKWSLVAAQREIDFLIVRSQDPETAVKTKSTLSDFPAIRRLRASTPHVLHSLPDQLGAHPGTPFLEASEFLGEGRSVVALDPGGDLSNWKDLRWLDRSTGEVVPVTTDQWNDWESIPLETLTVKATRWSRPSTTEPIDQVVVDPNLVQYRGRVSGAIDAQSRGEARTARQLAKYRPTYADADRAAYVVSEVRRLGPTAFADWYSVAVDTAKKIAAGRPPARSTIEKVFAVKETERRTCGLEGCDAPITRSNQLWCSDACRKKAKRGVRSRKVA